MYLEKLIIIIIIIKVELGRNRAVQNRGYVGTHRTCRWSRARGIRFKTEHIETECTKGDMYAKTEQNREQKHHRIEHETKQNKAQKLTKLCENEAEKKGGCLQPKQAVATKNRGCLQLTIEVVWEEFQL